MAVKIIKQGVLSVRNALTRQEVYKTEGSIRTLSAKYKEFLKSQRLLGTIVSGSEQHQLNKMASFTYHPISQPKGEKYECILTQLPDEIQPAVLLKSKGITLKDSYVMTRECLGITSDRYWASRQDCNFAYEQLKNFHDGIDSVNKPQHREFKIIDSDGDVLTVSMKHYSIDEY